MARPIKNANRNYDKPMLYGVWTLKEFAEASPRTYGWWLEHIKNYPALADFSNWATKSYCENWAFDAVKANEWLLDYFVYKRC
ncbi:MULTISPECIES: hypothetical protein [Listeria]|uniref:hypothetical protein n=1 Tax=Listeria TaxID=1637 RepID=UPI000B58B8ED|nr:MULTISPECIES: hypothetical protein [Listeria]